MNNHNLVFLVSQPRGGSTLLQKILSCHPKIHTIAEPWLMLHPLYALRQQGFQAEYGHKIAKSALTDLISSLPNKEEDYYEGLRRMYSYLYESLLQDTDKQYFLDKTPRYYLIINDIYKVFPNAKFIILLRNPLAVLCSIMSTWIRDDISKLKKYKSDLLTAPKLLIDGLEKLNDKCIVIHYEQLLKKTEQEVEKILNFLEIDVDLSIIDYNSSNLVISGKRGDQIGVVNNSRPSMDNIDKWIYNLREPNVWNFCYEYLDILGSDTIEKLGYSYEEIQNILRKNKPRNFYFLKSASLKKVLDI